MFDFTGFFSRDDHNDADVAETDIATAAEDNPMDFVVMKNGRPFAILNATPGLAEYTMAGFALATPEAQWVLARG